MLLKPGALNGLKHVENFEVEVEGQKFEVQIRALKHNESAEIQQILSKAVKMSGFQPKADGSNVNVDTAELVKSQYEAALKATAYGVVDQDWNLNSINDEWPSELINTVGKQVMLLTGIGNPEEVARFRERK